MAEHVQATLDRMVDGLIAIRDYGNDFPTTAPTTTAPSSSSSSSSNAMAIPPLISAEEMSSIIGRRRSYEYLLRRRQPRQSDFLLYLQYEIQLYELIQLRYKKYYQSNKAFQKYLQQQKKKWNEDIDTANNDVTRTNQYQKKPVQYIIQHIHTLYQRTIRQYRYSYTMVQQYVEFCTLVAATAQSHAPKPQHSSSLVLLPPYSSTITKIYQNAIKYHCTNIQLWYDMIRYEYQYYQQESQSTNTARIGTLRILFQRALRFHSQNISLWKSFMTMEWNHCQNQIRHLDNLNDDDDDDAMASADTTTQDNESHIPTTKTNPYHVLHILYDSALKAIHDEYSNLSFRIQCYQMVIRQQSHDDATPKNRYIETLQQHILESIMQYTETSDHVKPNGSSISTTTTNTRTNKELFVMVRATMCVLQQRNSELGDNDPTKNPVLQIIRDAVHLEASSPTITMVYSAIQFLRSYYSYLVAKRPKNPPSSPTVMNSDHDIDMIQPIRTLVREIYQTCRNRMESSTNAVSIHTSSPDENGVMIAWSDIVYEYVMFVVNDATANTTNDDVSLLPSPTPRKQWEEAIQILQDYIDCKSPTMSIGKPKNASLFILLAKLIIDMEMNDFDVAVHSDNDVGGSSRQYDSAIDILEQAIQLHIPIHQQPDHFVLLEQLLCLYVAKVTYRNKDNTTNENQNSVQLFIKIKQLMDQMILVGPKEITTHTGGRDLTVTRHIPNILVACQHYVPYLYEYTTRTTKESQQPKHWRQWVDQIFLHPSNVIVNQWISLIQMEQSTSGEHSSISDTNPTTSTPGRYNVFAYLLDTFNDFTSPLDTTSGSNTMTALNALGEDMVAMSSKINSPNKTNLTIVHELIEYIIEHETAMTTLIDGKNRLLRIYDQAIYIFQQLSLKVWARHYQQRKSDDVLYNNIISVGVMNKKRSLILPMNSDVGETAKHIKTNTNTRRMAAVKKEAFTIPVVDASDDNFQMENVIQLYDQYQIVHIQNVLSSTATTQPTTNKSDNGSSLSWKDLSGTFQTLNDMDQKSWCIETNTTTKSNIDIIPERFLAPVITKDRAYCSFVVQHSKEVYADTLSSLPFQAFDTSLMQYETAIWFFFGRNPIGNINMDGRPEHTDAISHNGTWHYQLSGRKRWSIRPTIELLHLLDCLDVSTASQFSVNCNAGDLLMINTRLWFHQTIIPPQRNPSVSYARDFRIITNGKDQLIEKQSNDDKCTMTNVDGLYATSDILQGTIMFTELDMPDCELHRSSTDPNCEVVELEDGTSAVMATRTIASGEFFCVPESSDDEEVSEAEVESETE